MSKYFKLVMTLLMLSVCACSQDAPPIEVPDEISAGAEAPRVPVFGSFRSVTGGRGFSDRQHEVESILSQFEGSTGANTNKGE